MDVGKRVRERRLRRGLVIEELARKTGLSKAYISQIETGKASPSLRTAERLAQALEVPLTYLFLEDALSCQVIRKAERPRSSRFHPWLMTSGRTRSRRSWRTHRNAAPLGLHIHLWQLPV